MIQSRLSPSLPKQETGIQLGPVVATMRFTPCLDLECKATHFPGDYCLLNSKIIPDDISKPIETDNDAVNHPSHYNNSTAKCKKCNHQIECIDVVREFNFNLGNVIKYLWRAMYKNSVIQDLKKAIWCLEDEVKRLEGKPHDG